MFLGKNCAVLLIGDNCLSLSKQKAIMKQKILFVCLGNICRSPAAHAVMEAVVEREGLQSQIEIDSAGTYGGHAGDLPDP